MKMKIKRKSPILDCVKYEGNDIDDIENFLKSHFPGSSVKKLPDHEWLMLSLKDKNGYGWNTKMNPGDCIICNEENFPEIMSEDMLIVFFDIIKE